MTLILCVAALATFYCEAACPAATPGVDLPPAPVPPAAIPTPLPAPLPFPWDADKQGHFITALGWDSLNRVWVGAEDLGTWRYDPALPEKDRWTHFTTADGLGDDNVYAIAFDRLGRTWLGSLNHGVSVWNGVSWKTYGPLEGPLGSRVFAITTSPVDGDVWISTEAGLSRYSLERREWTYITRAGGLPGVPCPCLAFDKAGKLYVGTQCDGIGIASPADNYKFWATVRAPEDRPMPNTPGGAGLPTNLINALLVSTTGTVWAGTTTGLARLEKGAKEWRFLRGKEWESMVAGEFHGDAPQKTDTKGFSLAEDYVTCLAESGGRLYVGHRQQGWEVFDEGTGKLIYPGPQDKPSNEYVNAILPLPGRPTLIGSYLDGVMEGQPSSAPEVTSPVPSMNLLVKTTFPATDSPRSPTPATDAGRGEKTDLTPRPPSLIRSQARREGGASPKPPLSSPAILSTHPSTVPSTHPHFPTPAAPPSLQDLQAALKRVEGLPLSTAKAVVLGEEWNTQGDWVGRYGSRYACLYGAGSPLDHYIIGDRSYRAIARSGPNLGQGDSLRHWIHWLHADDNPRVLWDPVIGGRREAEVDDHGETYGRERGGMGVGVHIEVPAGVHRVVLYEYNKDGHTVENRWRDYQVVVKPDAERLEDTLSLPTLAHTRVKDFWGGVYKQFLLRGPGKYWVIVLRNNSFNTILQSVMMDKVAGFGAKPEGGRSLWLRAAKWDRPFDPSPSPSPKRRGETNDPSPSPSPKRRGEPVPQHGNPSPPGPDPRFASPASPKRRGGKRGPNPPTPFPNSLASSQGRGRKADPSPLALRGAPAVVGAARALWLALDRAYENPGSAPLQYPLRVMAYRAVDHAVKLAPGSAWATRAEDMLTRWRHEGPLWFTDSDRKEFHDEMARMWQAVLVTNPGLRGVK